MKLNDLIKTNKIVAYGFGAFKQLEQKSNQNGSEVVVATDSPAIMYSRGIYEYYAPVIPRDSRFSTAEKIIAADLYVQTVSVNAAEEWAKNQDGVVIVTRHQGTIDILKDMYPTAAVLTGNVTAEDITGMHVIGVLPPHLIQYCKSFKAATIKDFDYSKDGDLSDKELLDRLVICEPIKVTVKNI